MIRKGDYSEYVEGSRHNLFKNIYIFTEAPKSDKGPTNLNMHRAGENNGFSNYSVICIESKRLPSQKDPPVILAVILVCIELHFSFCYVEIVCFSHGFSIQPSEYNYSGKKLVS